MKLVYLCAYALVRNDMDAQVVVDPDGDGERMLRNAAVAESGDVCCGIEDAAQASLQICRAPAEKCEVQLSEDECAAYGAEQGSVPQCFEDISIHESAEVDNGASVFGDTDQPAATEYGTACEDQSGCGPGFVCSRNVCKYAALEKCTWSWGSSKCASQPYGAGHKFQCKTHRLTQDRRCCIPNQAKHWGHEQEAIAKHRVLKLPQYQSVHPERVTTAKNGEMHINTADGLQFSVGQQTHEPMPKIVGSRLVKRGLRYSRVGGELYVVPGSEVRFVEPACCSGWKVYARDGVTSSANDYSNQLWYCGW